MPSLRQYLVTLAISSQGLFTHTVAPTLMALLTRMHAPERDVSSIAPESRRACFRRALPTKLRPTPSWPFLALPESHSCSVLSAAYQGTSEPVARRGTFLRLTVAPHLCNLCAEG